MRKDRKNLLETFQKTLGTSSIIAQMYLYGYVNHAYDMSYIADNATAIVLDDYYFYSWSGEKYASPVVEKMFKTDEEHAAANLAKMFVETHWKQLLKQWENFTKEYDPTANYHVTESLGYTHSGSGSQDDSGTDAKVRSGSVKQTGKTTSTKKVAPYDSGTFANAEQNEVVADGTNSPTTTYQNVTDSITYGKSRSTSDSAEDSLETTKEGNLGITPMAQLLQLDIELWKMNFYTSIFFPALDKFLALQIYGSI